MNTVDTHTTLAGLVTAHPSLARELEQLGLDYCCGGTSTLEEACALNGLDEDAVATQLSDASRDDTPADWSAMAPAELVAHLVDTHHRYLWTELPRLCTLAVKVAEVHGARHPELHDVVRLMRLVRLDLEPHLQKEEQILFPMITELAASATAPTFHCGSLANPIRVMRHDHDRAGELLDELRRGTDDFTVPSDGCASYRALYDGLRELAQDTHLHVHKENNVLFPAVLELERRPGSSS